MIYYESEIVELKESVNETLAKEMVAFLNSFGGTIYIGVTDKGIVTQTSQLKIARKALCGKG